MYVRLEITTPGQAVQKSKIDGATIILGRDPACQVPFDGKANAAVSWQHARIDVAGGGAAVSDLGSSNGTFVNGAPVTGKKTIQQGDIIGLGQTGPKVRVVEISLAPVHATVAEKLLPHGMLTPPVGSKPLNVSTDSSPSRPKRRRSSFGGVALGLLAIGAVAAAGIVVFKSQQKTEEKKDAVVAEAPKDKESKGVETPEKIDTAKPQKVAALAKADLDKKDTPNTILPEPPKTEKDLVKPSPPVPAPYVRATEVEIYRRTLQSTGWVTVPKTPPLMGTGTGSFVDQDKRLFLTAYHVIAGATEARIYFPRNDDDGRTIAVRNYYLDKERPVIGDVVVADPKRDLAILRLRSLPAAVVVLPLAPRGVDIAHKVYTVGNPGVSGSLWVYTEGSVRQVVPNKKVRLDNKQDVEAWMVEAQLAINQGDSGGPVVNDRMELVGVNSSLATKGQLMSNIIDLREIQTVLEQARRMPLPFVANPGLDKVE
jgi:S1-C subfamily serine protease